MADLEEKGEEQVVPGLAERMARVEGALEQMGQRLNHIKTTLGRLGNELGRLRDEFSRLGAKIDANFRWTIGIILTMWVTIILAILLRA